MLYEVITATDENIVAIHFDLTIDGVINSEFVSLIGIDLAKTLAESMLSGFGGEEPVAEPVPEPTPPPAPAPIPAPEPQPSQAQPTPPRNNFV